MGKKGHWSSGESCIKKLAPMETCKKLSALNHHLSQPSLDRRRDWGSGWPFAHVDSQEGQTPLPTHSVTLITENFLTKQRPLPCILMIYM